MLPRRLNQIPGVRSAKEHPSWPAPLEKAEKSAGKDSAHASDGNGNGSATTYAPAARRASPPPPRATPPAIRR